MNIQVLNEQQIENIKRSTEHLLDTIGFRVRHPEILKLAVRAGAKFDSVMETIRLPVALQREMLSHVGSIVRAGHGGDFLTDEITIEQLCSD